MEQFMKHFIRAILSADPKDILMSLGDEDDSEEDADIADGIDDDDDAEDSLDVSSDEELSDFLEQATNVYRTKHYIVRQQILYKNDPLLGAYLCSHDTFFSRTPERDHLYAKAFPKRANRDGKRIPTLMYDRKYID